MIIDYDGTIGHNRGHPTGLSHEEKMDVIACLLDEGEKRYVNEASAVSVKWSHWMNPQQWSIQ